MSSSLGRHEPHFLCCRTSKSGIFFFINHNTNRNNYLGLHCCQQCVRAIITPVACGSLRMAVAQVDEYLRNKNRINNAANVC